MGRHPSMIREGRTGDPPTTIGPIPSGSGTTGAQAEAMRSLNTHLLSASNSILFHIVLRKYLLWFHHVGWDYRMRSGRTLWEELCHKYSAGTGYVDAMLGQWESLRGAVDAESFVHVKTKLEKQRVDAGIWRHTCLGYFRRYIKHPLPNPSPRTGEASRNPSRSPSIGERPTRLRGSFEAGGGNEW
jgi:hypothetical protein